MAASCPNCGEQFRLGQAICDDWRDAQRNFGCPHCGVFLRTEATGPQAIRSRAGIRAGVLAGLVGSPAFALLLHGYAVEDVVVMFAAGAILLGFLALMLVDLWGIAKPLVPTGHRREIEREVRGQSTG